MSANPLSSVYPTQKGILSTKNAPVLASAYCQLYTAIQTSENGDPSFTQANFSGYAPIPLVPSSVQVGTPGQSPTEYDWDPVTFTTLAGVQQVDAISLLGEVPGGTKGTCFVKGVGVPPGFSFNFTIGSPGFIYSAVGATPYIFMAFDAQPALAAILGTSTASSPNIPGSSTLYITHIFPAANDPSFSVSLSISNFNTKPFYLLTPKSSNNVIKGVAPKTINQTILGAYVTDVTANTVLGWAALPAPVALSRGGQSITIQPGLPWAA